MATKKRLNDRMLNTLRAAAVRSAVSGDACSVMASTLVSDGRQKRSILKECKEDPRRFEVDGEYIYPKITVMDGVVGSSINMLKIWTENYEKQYGSHTGPSPWVRVSQLDLCQQETLVNTLDHFTYYVVDDHPYRYSTSRWTDEPETDDEHLSYWAGPFTLDEAMEHQAEVRERGTGGKVWNHAYEIVVSMENLPTQVEEYLAEKEIDRLMPVNLAWGLVECGVLEEDEAWHPKPTDKGAKRQAKVSAAGLGSSLFMGGNMSNLGEDPSKWQEALAKGLQGTLDGLRKAQERLTTLSVLTVKMAEYGGWDKFNAAYRVKLAEALKAGETED